MKEIQTPLKLKLHALTTLGEQHTLKFDDDGEGPVAIVFNTTGSLGPAPGEIRGKRLRDTWNACLGLELPDNVPPGLLAEVVAGLRSIVAVAGNLPDDRLETKTGPNDAAARGIMVTSMRSIAKDLMAKLAPIPPVKCRRSHKS